MGAFGDEDVRSPKYKLSNCFFLVLVFGHGDLLVLVLSDNYVGRPENDFPYLCWTVGSTDLDVVVLASGSETSEEGHESRGRPNEFLSPCWTDERSIWNDLVMGCETTAEYCSQFRTIEKVK